jgi:hypothetical protein
VIDHGAFYSTRLQYHPPWKLTRWWWLDARFLGYEFCNDSFALTLPFLGQVVVFYERVLSDVRDDAYPCEKCMTDIYAKDPRADPACHLTLDRCEACRRDFCLPRDRHRLLCEHLAHRYGTDDVCLAYHAWFGGHSGERCRCLRNGWFTRDDVLHAVAARKEEEGRGKSG